MACPLPVSSRVGGEGWGPLSSLPLRLTLWSGEVGYSPQWMPATAPDLASTSPGELCIRSGGARGVFGDLRHWGTVLDKLENVRIGGSEPVQCGRPLEPSPTSRAPLCPVGPRGTALCVLPPAVAGGGRTPVQAALVGGLGRGGLRPAVQLRSWGRTEVLSP